MGARQASCALFFLVHFITFQFEKVIGGIDLSPFCLRANSNFGRCPEVSTFDIVDIAAYAGLWYEIGSTAQDKLMKEAGSNCLQSNYTLQQLGDGNQGASLTVVNSGIQTLDPVAALGITSVSSVSRDVCTNARDVCSLMDTSSKLTQSITELRKIAYVAKKKLPYQAEILDYVAQQIEGCGYNISKEFTMVAEHIQAIQRFDGYLSEGNGTAAANVEQMRLSLIAAGKHINMFVVFVSEIATARSLLDEVVVKLIMAGELVSSVDVTEASAVIGTVEQSIALHAEEMKTSISIMNAALEVVLADSDKPFHPVSWSIPGTATQNATAKGRLELSGEGLDAPYWIIALEGLPSKGYDAALVYSCTENPFLNTIQQYFLVLSRETTIVPAILDRFVNVATSIGINLDCENVLLTSGCNSSPLR